jgi:hypothetical protein
MAVLDGVDVVLTGKVERLKRRGRGGREGRGVNLILGLCRRRGDHDGGSHCKSWLK